jgi:hypothetical protein
MNDEHKKALEELVSDFDSFQRWTFTVPDKYKTAILAADVELKRLREAVEWVLEADYDYRFLSFEKRSEFKAELRRKAGKEG